MPWLLRWYHVFFPGYTFTFPFALLSSTKMSPLPVTSYRLCWFSLSLKLKIVCFLCISSRFCLFYPSLRLQVKIFFSSKNQACRLTALLQNELLHYGKNTELLLFVLSSPKAHFYNLSRMNNSLTPFSLNLCLCDL